MDRLPAPVADALTKPAVERASATSARRTRAVSRDAVVPVQAEPAPRTLADVEAWMVRAIVSRDALPAVADVVTDGPRLTAADRFEIYRSGYRSRLVECLRDDYPVLAESIGAERFDALCSAYVDRHPSRSPSLNAFGRHMARFCREADVFEVAERVEFFSELAELEWAVVEAIHAEAPTSFDAKRLEGLAPEAWGDVRFVPSSAVRLLRFGFPVNGYYQAHRNGRAPAIPGRSESSTAVYRCGLTLWRMDLTPAMERVLRALLSGAPLGLALSQIGVDETDPSALAEAERSVMIWFREWVRSGFFADVLLPD